MAISVSGSKSWATDQVIRKADKIFGATFVKLVNFSISHEKALELLGDSSNLTFTFDTTKQRDNALKNEYYRDAVAAGVNFESKEENEEKAAEGGTAVSEEDVTTVTDESEKDFTNPLAWVSDRVRMQSGGVNRKNIVIGVLLFVGVLFAYKKYKKRK